MLPLVVTLLIFACSHRSHATGFDTGECGRTKGCFLPEDLECYNGCSGMRFSWILIDEGLMKFEITVDANSSNGIYVAVGFSHDDMMGDDSVIECSSIQGEALSLKLSYNINGTTDNSTDGEPTNRRLSNNGSEYFSQSLTSFTNGTVYCAGVLNITGAVEAGLLDFDPTNYYYLLMASGPTDKKGLLRHIHSVATPTALQLINIVPDFDIDPCGISKGCYLATNEDHTLNGVAVSYR
ncbi:DOMON domain protein [Necator americanus]|uniref:DOMON domain protein n=1 Tax=Necator americanus TaxID=51031 RepID=W2TU25_NECAM|nr:DOMON domain protein [Necator americanus]ETN85273.1 DOMON domain protein [Necator americanus]